MSPQPVVGSQVGVVQLGPALQQWAELPLPQTLPLGQQTSLTHRSVPFGQQMPAQLAPLAQHTWSLVQLVPPVQQVRPAPKPQGTAQQLLLTQVSPIGQQKPSQQWPLLPHGWLFCEGSAAQLCAPVHVSHSGQSPPVQQAALEMHVPPQQ